MRISRTNVRALGVAAAVFFLLFQGGCAREVAHEVVEQGGRALKDGGKPMVDDLSRGVRHDLVKPLREIKPPDENAAAKEVEKAFDKLHLAMLACAKEGDPSAAAEVVKAAVEAARTKQERGGSREQILSAGADAAAQKAGEELGPVASDLVQCTVKKMVLGE